MPRPPTDRYCIIRRYRRADGTCDAKLLEAGPLTHERPFAADISVQIERQRQLERDVLRLAAELRRRGLLTQETML